MQINVHPKRHRDHQRKVVAAAANIFPKTQPPSETPAVKQTPAPSLPTTTTTTVATTTTAAKTTTTIPYIIALLNSQEVKAQKDVSKNEFEGKTLYSMYVHLDFHFSWNKLFIY